MSEIVEPQPSQHVCDWAAGSGGLLLQCRNYVERHYGKKDSERLFFYMQESNPSTANISRINMYLHGVRGFHQAPPSDSLRTPYFREGQTKRLRQFDRIVMNPPFSLEEWGYDDFIGGDSYDRFGFGTPPRDNGDYAWLLQVVKSLKATGKAIVVMSQGVLFRGQPAQTEREDGRNQKADSEYTIREAFVKADLIESIIILPSKLFYGNNVPGCLVVLSKRKASERKGKILLVWASRDYQASNPQNLLRRVDCMRVLAVWKAFGHLERCKATIPAGEAAFLREVEKEHAARLQEIEDAYAPDLITLAALRKKLEELELLSGSPAPQDKKEKAKHREQKKLITEKAKQVKREIKRLGKLELEAEQLKVAARDEYGGEQRLIKETAANMLDICSNTEEARRHFAVVDVCELASNDFNLNVPRYVDTPDVDAPIPLSQAAPSFKSLADNFEFGTKSLMQVLGASLSNER